MRIGSFMMKKNYFDIAETNTRKALKLRNDQEYSNTFLTVPFLKIKYKILEIEIDNALSDRKNAIPTIEKCEKLIKVVEDQMKTYNFDENSLINLNLLNIKTTLNISLFSLNENDSTSIVKEDSTFFKTFLRAYKLFDNQTQHLEPITRENFMASNYIKLLRPIIKFSDKMLRNILKGDVFDKLSQIFVENGLKSLILGDSKSLSVIPKIFPLLSKNPILGQVFKETSVKVPSNYFLKWKSQIIAYINSNISVFISPIVLRLLKTYPQSLYFPFSVIEKYSELLLDFQDKSQLFYEVKKYYSEFFALNAFLESLDSLTNPEHRLKYWIENIKESFQEEKYEIKIKKIEVALGFLYYDILELKKKYINTKLGTYNLKFAKDYEKNIKNILNITNLTKLANSSLSYIKVQNEFSKLVEPITSNLNKSLNSQSTEGIEKLATYSEYLAQYECNEFYDPKYYIELPLMNSDSDSLKTVKISSFEQNILVLNSIRKPKSNDSTFRNVGMD